MFTLKQIYVSNYRKSNEINIDLISFEQNFVKTISIDINNILKSEIC